MIICMVGINQRLVSSPLVELASWLAGWHRLFVIRSLVCRAIGLAGGVERHSTFTLGGQLLALLGRARRQTLERLCGLAAGWAMTL